METTPTARGFDSPSTVKPKTAKPEGQIPRRMAGDTATPAAAFGVPSAFIYAEMERAAQKNTPVPELVDENESTKVHFGGVRVSPECVAEVVLGKVGVVEAPEHIFDDVMKVHSNPPRRSTVSLSDSLDRQIGEVAPSIQLESGEIDLLISNWVRVTRFALAIIAICILGVFLGSMVRFYLNPNTNASAKGEKKITKAVSTPLPIVTTPSAPAVIRHTIPCPTGAIRTLPTLRTGAVKPVHRRHHSDVDKNFVYND